MGLVAGRRVGDLRKVGLFLLAFGVLVPLVNGALGVAFGKFAGLELGGATLLGCWPPARPTSRHQRLSASRCQTRTRPRTLTSSAGVVTFPFNITLGIPVYPEVARSLLPLSHEHASR